MRNEPDALPDAEPEAPDEGLLDGEDEEPELPDGEDVEPELPDGDVALLPADPLLPLDPIDPDELELDFSPAATATPETAERAKAKSTALLRNFMRASLQKKRN